MMFQTRNDPAYRRHTRSARVLLCFLLILSSFAAFPQLRTFPLPRNGDEFAATRNPSEIARSKALEPLVLPFWDDFSKPFLGMYPDTALWEKGYTVWVNNGMAIKPPTLNVATFDGLDSAGIGYNNTDIFITGYTDSLVSRAIDLTEHASNPVSMAERSTVYLSFLYQWKGNGEAPDIDEDYLEVEFQDASGKWASVLRIEPTNTLKADTFYAAIIPVTGDSLFHEHFRFRFRSFGRQSGPYDTWNIDYVYLNKGRHANDLSFPDRAISTPLGPLFGSYRSMPRRHLRSNEQFNHVAFEIQNMKNALATLNFRTEATFYSENTTTGESSSFETVLKDSTAINITNGILLSREHKTIRLDTIPSLSNTAQFPPGMDSTAITLKVTLNTGDNVPVNPDGPGDYTPNYEPILFTLNDTVQADYHLSTYYAYDDGVAEYAAGLIESGNLAAVAFDLPFDETFTQDTLVAFDVYFPPHGIRSNQIVDFTIYRDNDGVPGAVLLSVPSRRVNNVGLNTFQRFKFIPAVLVTQPRFYIGWKAPVEGLTLIGLDMSSDTGDRMFVNTTGTWQQNQLVRGSLMIRPVFGSGEIGDNVGVEDPPRASVYPNPSRGRFVIEGTADDIQIFSATGNQASFRAERATDITTVELIQPPGLYILRYRQGSFIRTEKIVILGN